MASGWASDDAVNQQIDSTIVDAITNARRQLHHGIASAHFCVECGDIIAEARRQALPGVQYCLSCQQEIDKQTAKAFSLYNRRGSKDSQLR
ncbi:MULTISPECIES: DksA/TraR family C4-type zinc finger protein [unclassified Gilliamella]|uniref:DksA/TraR family C4-type zinc finger protein n=1 Tax=unclassified Gilliamella TaxID=2685620 RepID=UPI0013233974|nr:MULTISPECIES: DksA/TraR family C4-type zinc finger protein [unclassified Gilliamella]MWN31163.1 DksA/TraR family C4-type zinc finger protein [Gilliamella sp. Pra-s60]MWP29784.1 DksA/TraR family C4-type zinc finger protein [Gilliamella sp. Pra-s54]MWP46548.1 DksA/TraR family C4-type zinc finger protein [Gilliamella sp. Pas-s27]